jgi:hypothetical protein
MQSLIQSLINSVPGLFNVAFFLFFIMLIFAIFGVHQFQGAQYNRCRLTEEPLINSTTFEYQKWEIDWRADWLCNSGAQC